jgi:hypothetical protein
LVIQHTTIKENSDNQLIGEASDLMLVFCSSSKYFKITPYVRMLDSDWLIAMIFFTSSGLAL